jgi:hypothetical protein
MGNFPNSLNQTSIKQQISLNNLETLSTTCPNSRIPEQSWPGAWDEPVGLFSEVEIRGRPWLGVKVAALLQRFGRVDWNGGCT